MPKKLKIFSLEIHEGAGIKKNKKFLNKGTKHKKNYIKIKILKVADHLNPLTPRCAEFSR